MFNTNPNKKPNKAVEATPLRSGHHLDVRKNMNSGRIYLLIALSAALALALGVAGLAILSNRASDQVLNAIHRVEPGMHIALVRERLGKEMYEIDDEAWMDLNASLKKSEFRKGKKLYWFYVSAPPARAIEIYTNQEDRVVYVTWQGQ